VVIAKANYLQNLLGSFGHPEKYLINTETALLCGSDGKEPICQTVEFEQTKANYVAQSFAASLATGLRANIWYSLRGWRGSGLVQTDMQPIPAFNAFEFSLRALEFATYQDAITDYPGIMGYQFAKNEHDFWVIWGIEENPVSINLPRMPQRIFDVYGNPLQASQTLTVTTEVLYLEFSP
jgi:hypothetical protein